MGVLYTALIGFGRFYRSLSRVHSIYVHRRGAFGVARFGLTGQCEGLRIVERVTDWLHVLLFCIFANKKLTLLW